MVACGVQSVLERRVLDWCFERWRCQRKWSHQGEIKVHRCCQVFPRYCCMLYTRHPLSAQANK